MNCVTIKQLCFSKKEDWRLYKRGRESAHVQTALALEKEENVLEIKIKLIVTPDYKYMHNQWSVNSANPWKIEQK